MPPRKPKQVAYVIEDAPESNAGRPRIHYAELDAIASNWQDVPVLEQGKGIHIPHPANVGPLGNADKALVRHHLKVTLAECGITKDDYTTFSGKDGALKFRRIR